MTCLFGELLHRYVDPFLTAGTREPDRKSLQGGRRQANSGSKAVQFAIFDHCEQNSRATSVTYPPAGASGSIKRAANQGLR
jgi:hypothetical protein